MDLITRLFSFVYKVQASGAGDDSSTFRSKFTRGFSMPLGRGTRQLFVLRFWKQPYLRLVLCIRHILRVKIHRSPVKSRGRNMLDTRYNFKLIPFFFFFRNSWTWYHPTPDYIIAKIYIYISRLLREYTYEYTYEYTSVKFVSAFFAIARLTGQILFLFIARI